MNDIMKAAEALRIAGKHIGKGDMVSSAERCLKEAEARWDERKFDSAYLWAKKSISYSVGVFHPDYGNI